MAGDAGDGGEGETQALDGGTPPLGSPVSDDGDATPTEGEEDGVLYGETQVLDDVETQMVDDGLGEEEEEEEGVAVDWGETQLVEDSEEGRGGDVDEQDDTQLVEDSEEDGGGACEQVKHAAAGSDNNAGDLARTQLVEGHTEGEDGGNNGAGDGLETQFVEECPEDERVNNSSDEDVGEWGKTQLVEDSHEEKGDDGDDELSVDTQVLSDDEGLSNDEREVKFGTEGSNVKVNGVLENHVDAKILVDSDASTDEEGDIG
ncbi:hypothetical protein E2562_017215 [Oryza meyeriana var. granulata]|uniref:Uncharacterized protein n=1 Tax=Oryza meyeriana var. granulata TaxID=110450 RepID=A0A6G1ELC5_9ORYZ|nr:hypothetical protein E2562_017215 [Oryza meyeriana var. granulata]